MVLEISFSDIRLDDFSLNVPKKELSFAFKGYYDLKAKQLKGPCQLTFHNWEKAIVREYSSIVPFAEPEINECSLDKEFEAFETIQEFIQEGEKTILRGFGRDSGTWIELILEGIEVVFSQLEVQWKNVANRLHLLRPRYFAFFLVQEELQED